MYIVKLLHDLGLCRDAEDHEDADRLVKRSVISWVLSPASIIKIKGRDHKFESPQMGVGAGVAGGGKLR